MKYKLPILTVMVAVVSVALGHRDKTRILLNLIHPRPTAIPTGTTPPQLNPASSQHIDRAIAVLEKIPSLETKLRVQVQMHGHSLSGIGTYLQNASDSTVRSRLELKMQVAERVTSFLQVCDGRFIWQRDDLQREPRLIRLDLRRLREARFGDDSQDSATPLGQPWLLLGGMSRLLRDLDDNFIFVQTATSRRGDLPVWILDGVWRSERLAELVPALRQEIAAGNSLSTDKSPAFLPHYVRLTLGRDDALPGFPYLVEYFRTTDPTWSRQRFNPESSGSPFVSMEIYEVRVPDHIDQESFRYNPANQDVIDRTDELLTRSKRPR